MTIPSAQTLSAQYEEATRVYLKALHDLSDDRLPHAEILARSRVVEEARAAWHAARTALAGEN